MKFIDLHVHSTMSDGSYTPRELVQLAKKRGVSAITLSDHDTIDGINEAAQEALCSGVEFIPGMEVSIDYRNRKLHAVALGFDYNHPAFKSLYKNIRAHKENQMERVIDRIREKGVDISLEKVRPFVYGEKMERYAIMRYMTTLHLTDTMQELWDTYLNPTIQELGLNKNVGIAEAAEGIHQAGGVLSLAHFHKLIGLMGMSRREQETAIAELHGMGLDGMEKYYTNYSENDKAFAAAMIEKYDLLPTGGSDFHGKNRIGVELGTGTDNNLCIPYELYENILRHCGKH